MKKLLSLIVIAAFCCSPAISSALSTAPEIVRQQATEGKYWISKTGKTHNSSCRFYKTCKGRASDTPSGDNCKICGGASK